nr:hypothetical protein [Tanacetum cinerariifolium]
MEKHNNICIHHSITNISNNIRGDKENIAPEALQFSQPLLPYTFQSIPIMDIVSVPSRDTTSTVTNPMTEARMLRKIIMNNKGQYIKRKGSMASNPRVINPSLQQNSHQYSLCNSNSNTNFAAQLSNESLSTLHEIHETQHSVFNNAFEARKRRRLLINNKKAKDSCVQLPHIRQRPNLRGLSIVNTANINRRTPFRDVTNEYVDIGDATYECSKCGAMLWKLESKRGMYQSVNIGFSLCCLHGKVILEEHLEPAPPLLKNLLSNNHSLSKHYIQNIRRYNMMFSFTSMGAKVDELINQGKGPYIYIIQGQNFHRMGSLVPVNSTTPKFCQLYIYDTENEVSNRIKASSGDSFCNNANVRFKIKLYGKRARDGRNYNLPEANEVAALIVGDIGVGSDKGDIVVQSHEGELQRISELHVLYLALQYPLIYARGEDGYRTDIDHAEESFSRTKKKKQVTMRKWLAYRILEINNGYSLLQNLRKLYQQFLVDGYTMLESQRLFFMRREQKNMRCASYSKLSSAVNNGETSTSGLGKRIYLPSSYTGGARYMVQNYLDAMSICKWYGYPDLFITFTCNTKWPEINRFMAVRNLKSEDRPEVVSRVFKMKLDTLIKVVYTVEFQKRGLPHSHICLFLHANDKLRDPKHIDRVISAEIPDKFSDPELYELVSDCMMHGSCGPGHTYSPCMKDKKTCSKKFPRKFCQETTIDEMVIRCIGDVIMIKRLQNLESSWTTGHDRATVVVVDEEVDEIKEYYDCPYVSSCEAAWRIFQFDIHERTPPVERLPFHLKGEPSVYFDEGSCIEDIVNNPSVNETMFTEWMEANKIYDEAKELTYVEFPTKFVWKHDIKKWRP